MIGYITRERINIWNAIGKSLTGYGDLRGIINLVTYILS